MPTEKKDAVFQMDSYGKYHIGVRVYVDVDRPLSEEDGYALNRLGQQIHDHLLKESHRLDPDEIKWRGEWIEKAKSIFKEAGLEPSNVADTENEYDGDPNSPWLWMVTKLGVFKVGWRKRVIVLSWDKTSVQEVATDLFLDEKVTMGQYYIHAHGYEKLLEYLKTLTSTKTAKAALSCGIG